MKQSALENLYEMLAYIRNQAIETGFNNTCVSKIELAAEEALVNIISHAYPAKNGTIDIACLSEKSHSLKITICDRGVAFNPLELVRSYESLNATEQLEDENSQLGGYGIYFIVNMMDKVDYLRTEEANVLTLTKHIPGAVIN